MRRLIEPSHLDLCFLQKPIIIAFDSERVKLVLLAQNLALNSDKTQNYKYIFGPPQFS